MKFKSIRLAAYGIFTEATIDLGGAGTGFHMIYGPNEAGKSTALRALRNLLFGIPARTPDSFHHGHPSLRIGAVITNSNGDTLEFLRRKGNAKTLRAPDDETVLDDGALVPFLGGVDRDIFEQMFAIGHDDLVRGGEEILSGRGNIGQALFAAGAGLIPLQAVQQGLETECGELFKPAGSKPRINQSIAAIKEARKRQKEALLPAKTWQDQERALREAKAQLETVRRKSAGYKQRTGKLHRIRDAHPLIARKKEIDTALSALVGVPDLPDDFGKKRQNAEKDLDLARRDSEKAVGDIEAINRQVADLSVPEALLHQAAAIETLQQKLGGYRMAQNDRPTLEGRMRTHRKSAADHLAEAGVGSSAGDIVVPALPSSTVAEIRGLGSRYDKLITRRDTEEKRHRDRKVALRQLAEARKSMPVPLEAVDIETTLHTAQEAGPVEKGLAGLKAEIGTLETSLIRALQRQTLWSGTLEDVDALPCPSTESIDHFEKRFDAGHRELEKLREAKSTIEKKMADISAKLQAVDRSGEVPTEANLESARSERGTGWVLIRRTLEGDAPAAEEEKGFTRQYENAETLPDAFEVSVSGADRIADRLRREADQVSRKELLSADLGMSKATLDETETALAAALQHQGDLQTEWKGRWAPCAITPLSPREMRAWSADISAVREKLVTLRENRAKHAAAEAELKTLKGGLSTALAAAGVPAGEPPALSPLIQKAKAFVDHRRQLQTDILSADKDIARLEAETAAASQELTEIDAALAEWKTEWGRHVTQIGLAADAGPAAALAVIESLREAKIQFDEAEVLKKRIAGIDRDAKAFADQVAALAEDLATDLVGEPPDRVAELLNSRLNEARESNTTLQGYKKQLAASQKSKDDAERQISQATALLEAMCREARCERLEDLAQTEEKARNRKAFLRELDGIEGRLRELGAGATVSDFIDEAAAVDADAIAPELEDLAADIEILQQEHSNLDQTIGQAKAELARMDGSADAAEAAESVERHLASLEADIARYARLKIAGVLLARTVEQYREKHQGPLIERASDLFAQMTIGAFSRLRADYDANGNPVLVGIRPDGGNAVTVDGMSDGTADQLYLALRLASLEQYLEKNEPLPFVVDDILLRFDDERSLATLEVLADLSNKTQVLFFTHHKHLLELVKSRDRTVFPINFQELAISRPGVKKQKNKS